MASVRNCRNWRARQARDALLLPERHLADRARAVLVDLDTLALYDDNEEATAIEEVFTEPTVDPNLPSIVRWLMSGPLLARPYLFLSFWETIVHRRICRAFTSPLASIDLDINCGGETARRFCREVAGTDHYLVSGEERAESRFPMLCHLHLRLGDEVLQQLIGVLAEGHLGRLQTLALEIDIDGGDDGVRSLCECLEAGSCEELTTLSLSGSYIGEDGAERLCQALTDGSRHFTLTALDVSRNGFERNGIKFLSNAFQAPTSGLLKLQSLNIARNHAKDGLNRLFGALNDRTCPELRHLDLSDNQATRAEAEALAEALRREVCPGLEVLDISHNSIGDAGAESILSALVVAHGTLRTLNMSGTDVSNPACDAIAFAAASGAFPELRTLNVSYNRIAHPGLKELAAALETQCCPELAVLNFGHNNLGNTGVRVMAARILPHQQKLQRLDIACNTAGQSMLQLAQALCKPRVCPVLKWLSIHGNQNTVDSTNSKALMRLFSKKFLQRCHVEVAPPSRVVERASLSRLMIR